MIRFSIIKIFRKEINYKVNDVFESYFIDLINSISIEEFKKKF